MATATTIDYPAKLGVSPEAVWSVESAIQSFRYIDAPIEKYLFLRRLQKEESDLFFKVLFKFTQEILPFIYTPTVGEACQRYHELEIDTRGLYIDLNDQGNILAKFKSWPRQNTRVIVITDGERILGLGDLGTGGMGISEGKIMLYTAAAGVDPTECLPVCVDVGTNNEALRNSSSYRGLKQPRITGEEYDNFMKEVIEAVQAWQPHVLLQFEDFGNSNAFRLLHTYAPKLCCFNDDIQGTACITLAGILSAQLVTGLTLPQQRIMFLGAGEAGTGIGELIAMELERKHNVTRQEGREHCYFLDSKGLVCASRTNLQHHKQPFAHNIEYQKDLLSAVKAIKPTVLIGVSTIAGAFTQEVVEAMTEYTDRPIIFPLSNPTPQSECTFEQAFTWTKEKVLFASGSPFPQITDSKGVVHSPAQANNAYIFPAVGHAAILTECSTIPDDVFLVAAETLAAICKPEEREVGLLFPPFQQIIDVSVTLIARVGEYMVDNGLGKLPDNFTTWEAVARSSMWSPDQKSNM